MEKKSIAFKNEHLQSDWDAMVKKEGKAFKECFAKHDVKHVLDASCGSGQEPLRIQPRVG